MAEYGAFNSFLVYSSIRSEVPTDGLIQVLTELGKQVYLPRVEGDDIVAVPYGELKIGAFGIQEPVGDAFDGCPDVCVVPLLGVNSKGYRIGYGRGFYDRYFKTHKCLRVGIGYGIQQTDFTEDAWDEPLDAFICEGMVVEYHPIGDD